MQAARATVKGANAVILRTASHGHGQDVTATHDRGHSRQLWPWPPAMAACHGRLPWPPAMAMPIPMAMAMGGLALARGTRARRQQRIWPSSDCVTREHF